MDIVNWLAFFHDKNIVHRDLKPANVLLSNQHYMNSSKEEILQLWPLGTIKPIICELAGLGESCLHLIQTRTLLSSKVKQLDRGSFAFMALEILLPGKRPSLAMNDKQAADLCALGMLMFVLANQSSIYMYKLRIEHELQSFSTNDSREVFKI